MGDEEGQVLALLLSKGAAESALADEMGRLKVQEEVNLHNSNSGQAQLCKHICVVNQVVTLPADAKGMSCCLLGSCHASMMYSCQAQAMHAEHNTLLLWKSKCSVRSSYLCRCCR